MTVRELIEALNELDPHREIILETGEYIEGISMTSIGMYFIHS